MRKRWQKRRSNWKPPSEYLDGFENPAYAAAVQKGREAYQERLKAQAWPKDKEELRKISQEAQDTFHVKKVPAVPELTLGERAMKFMAYRKTHKVY